MSDIINLLPDSVANQIAAGEVIQRPASVVKELLENAIDAGADNICLKVMDAGKTLIQVSDNGCGMSETDARMSFERHATSKIKEASDLFAIRTLGFRGEALASIAAVADVTLKTKRTEDEMGTYIHMSGSKIITQEAIGTTNGSTFTIKNLFFNIPARRKFLKANATELRHIINEFQRVALTNPETRFLFEHNNTELYNLPKSNIRQRIMQLFGKTLNQNLVDIKVETTIVNIKGYIGKPESAKKTMGDQFFFINGRYMRHPYFHKAVMNAYERLIPGDAYPSYFIYFETDPDTIDINIHPTKTEIKFEDERSIFQMVLSGTKEALGKFNLVPTLDFENETAIEIPVMRKNTEFSAPTIQVNPHYNPFENEISDKKSYAGKSKFEMNNLKNWDLLYPGIEKTEREDTLFVDAERLPKQENERESMSSGRFFQLKNKYILTQVKSGLMVIDQKRAHERILFEQYMNSLSKQTGIAQESLFPQTMELSLANYTLIQEILDDINQMGFDVRDLGNNTIAVNGYPANLGNTGPMELIEGFLENYKNTDHKIKDEISEKIAYAMAKAASIGSDKSLDYNEMAELFDKLFACAQPNYTHTGKSIITIIPLEEFENKLK
ncbi:MAG: DNA mismatch repair endonuclease MutL [Bacteroidales bacterium]|nr:DNA mismatch repair endonuclease MutL [Bacteroidales bacterium]